MTSRPARRVASLLACAAVAVAGATACLAQEQVPPGAALETQARAGRVLEHLQAGETVRVVAFGDSLTAGWGTDGVNVYHRIVADALQYWYHGGTIELIAHGHPGETTGDALRRFDADVVAESPHLLLVQFGGNDMGWGRPVRAFRRDLSALLMRALRDTSALVIACLPPISDPNPANLWSETARAVAAESAIPVADLDRAIREGDADCRGPFPYGSHPGGFTHVIMAREVLCALQDAMGVAPTVACSFVTGPHLRPGPAFEVEADIRGLTGAAIDCDFRLECEGAAIDDAAHIEPGQATRVALPLPIAPQPDAERSWGVPVRLLARGGGGFGGVDVCWLVTAPAIAADSAADGGEPAAPTWHDLGADALTIGRHAWLGPADLSGRFAVVALPDRLRFIVEVTDDSLAVATLDDPSQGDSVELYLDLRPDADQGKPVYMPGVLALQVIPTDPAQGPAPWRSMDPLPDDLLGIAVECAPTATGYAARIDLPLAAITELRGEAWQGLGFDVGVNDADFGGIRTVQMMWTGTGDNYLNPAYLAGLYVGELPAGAVRQTLQ